MVVIKKINETMRKKIKTKTEKNIINIYHE